MSDIDKSAWPFDLTPLIEYTKNRYSATHASLAVSQGNNGINFGFNQATTTVNIGVNPVLRTSVQWGMPYKVLDQLTIPIEYWSRCKDLMVKGGEFSFGDTSFSTRLNGKLESFNDMPSQVYVNGLIYLNWHKNGNLHRESLPAYQVFSTIGSLVHECYYRNGEQYVPDSGIINMKLLRSIF